MYTWFHVYRPMGPDANPELCLTPEQQLRSPPVRRRDAGEEADHHRRRLFRRRRPGPVPGGHGHQPPHQPLGRHRAVPHRAVHEGIDPRERGRQPAAARQVPAVGLSCATSATWRRSTTRGCIVLERPDLLKKLVEKHGAKDATVRGTALAELEAMEVRTSQYNPGAEVPEKNWLYRLAKRYWFYDFGAYEGFDHGQTSAPGLLRARETKSSASPQPEEMPEVLA